MRKTIALNTFYQLLARSISALVSLAITISISRSLGVFDFGELVKIISFTSIFYMPLDFGINAIALRLFNRHPKNISQTTSALISLRFLLSLVLVIITISIAYFLPGSQTQGFTPLVKTGIFILAFNTIFLGLIKSLHAVFQHYLKYQNIVVAQLIQAAVMLSAIVYTTTTSKSILTITYAYVLAGLLAFLSLWYLATRLAPLPRPTISLHRFKQLLIPALPLGFTITIITLNSRVDTQLLTLYRPTIELGHYGLAKRIFELFLVFPIFFSNSIYPLLLKPSTDQFRLLKRSIIAMLTASIVALALIYTLSPLVTLIKPEFVSAIPYLRLLSFTLPIFFLTAPLMWLLIARRRERALIYIYLFALLLNTTINLVFTPSVGPTSAIIALGLSELAALILIALTLYKHSIHEPAKP